MRELKEKLAKEIKSWEDSRDFREIGLNSLEKLLKPEGYVRKDRTFGCVKHFFKKGIFPFLINSGDRDVVYSGFEHPELPNITIIKNFSSPLVPEILGTTFGHYQGTDMLPIQEVYEFLGYGAMSLKKGKHDAGEFKVEFNFLRPREKVAVPSFCDMTIYNLDRKPLITLDYSNPKLNISKKYLEDEKGPLFYVYEDEDNTINFLWNLKHCIKSGPCIIHCSMRDNLIKIPLVWTGKSLGEELFSKFEEDEGIRKQFSDREITLKRGIKNLEIGDIVIEDLWDASQDMNFRRYFLMDEISFQAKREEILQPIQVRDSAKIEDFSEYFGGKKRKALLCLLETSGDVSNFVNRMLENDLKRVVNGQMLLDNRYKAWKFILNLAGDIVNRAKVTDDVAKTVSILHEMEHDEYGTIIDDYSPQDEEIRFSELIKHLGKDSKIVANSIRKYLRYGQSGSARSCAIETIDKYKIDGLRSELD